MIEDRNQPKNPLLSSVVQRNNPPISIEKETNSIRSMTGDNDKGWGHPSRIAPHAHS